MKQQDFDSEAFGILNRMKSILTLPSIIQPSKMQSLLIKKSEWANDDDYRTSPYLQASPANHTTRWTESESDFLSPEELAEWPPNVIDFAITLFNIPNFVDSNLSRKRESFAFPLTLFNSVVTAFAKNGRAGVIQLCLQARSSWLPLLFSSKLVVVPFIHPQLKDLALLLLRNNMKIPKQPPAALFAIEYSNDLGINLSARSRYWIGSVFRDFVDLAFFVYSLNQSKKPSATVVDDILRANETYIPASPGRFKWF